MPSRDKESVGESLKLFYREVPALQLIGSPQYIHPDIPYAVDADVQLVCKYLQAYKIKKIDRLYKEGCQLVKFSNDVDLSDDECHRLLQEHMPKHIASTKITQQLFIRCVCAYMCVRIILHVCVRVHVHTSILEILRM